MKRAVNLLLSLAYFAFWRVWDALRFAVTGRRAGSCVVLYYHNIAQEHRSSFARQMDMLLRSATPISGRDIPSPSSTGSTRRQVMITFDDGYQSAAEHAIPELKKRNIPATVFVVAGAFGRIPFWETFQESPSPNDKVVSTKQLRELHSEGVVIGSHTLTHPVLPWLTDEGAWREIADSRSSLERTLGCEVKLFSFPYGAFNQKLVDMCRQAGYESVFTTLPVPAVRSASKFVIGRVSVEPTDWPIEFWLKIAGAYAWLPLAFRLKKWTISLLRRNSQHDAERGSFATGSAIPTSGVD